MTNKSIRLTVVFLFLLAVLYSFSTVSSFTPGEHVVKKAVQSVPAGADYLLLVDFSKASAQERLYIYDVRQKNFVYSGVVQHGLGRGSTARHPEFSNEPGSRCSSLGLYRLTDYSRIFRIPYVDVPCFRMTGLSPTNSNARVRGILIHPSVTATLLPFELWGIPLPLTPESEGCFAVSIHTMWKIKQLFDKGQVYLYAYDGE